MLSIAFRLANLLCPPGNRHNTAGSFVLSPPSIHLANHLSPKWVESAGMLIDAIDIPTAIVDLGPLYCFFDQLQQRGVRSWDAVSQSAPDAFEQLLERAPVQHVNQAMLQLCDVDSAAEFARLLTKQHAGSLAAAVRHLLVRSFPVVDGGHCETELTWSTGAAGNYRCHLDLPSDRTQSTMAAIHLYQITEQKRLYDELARLHSQLQIAFHLGDVGVFEWQIRSGVIRFQDDSQQLAGFSANAPLQSTGAMFERMHPSDVSRVQHAQQLFVNGVSPSCATEYRVRGLLGQWEWLAVRCTALELDAAGLPVHAVGTIRVVSAEKLEAQLLALYNRALQTKASGACLDETLGELICGAELICDDIVCSIHQFDPGSGRFNHTTAPRMSPRFRAATSDTDLDQMFRSARAAVGSGCLYVDDDPGSDPFLQRLELPDALSAQAVWCLPMLEPMRAVLGVICFFSLESRQPLPIHATLLKQVVRFAALLLELDHGNTEREKLRQRFVQDQKLESLGLLAGGIAHDFNNLLAGMLANAELIKIETPSSSSPHECAEQICLATQRAADLCNQMLAYSGRGPSARCDVDVATIVEEMARLVQTNLPPTVEMTVDIAEQTTTAHADAGMISQVVLNLLTNAIDAVAEAGGRVQVRVGRRVVDQAELKKMYVDNGLREGDYVFIEVKDNGVGFNESIGIRLFDPFFSTKQKGRGLGLAAVLGITRQHRGGIRIQSKPNVGSSFCIVLPPTQAQITAAPIPPVIDSQLPRTALVVDDDPLVRESISRLLAGHGLEVITAMDGRHALQQFAQHRADIDLVVLDYQMPHLNGSETCQRLREEDPELPVIMISGLLDSNVEPEPLAVDNKTAVLTKPIRWNSMAEEIRRVTSARPRRQSA